MRFDTTALSAAVTRQAKIPLGSDYRTPSVMLDIATQEIETWVVPELIAVSGGHLMAYKDTALVSGQRTYRFPDRAIRPERLTIIDGDGRRQGQLYLASGDMVDKVLAGVDAASTLDWGMHGDALGYWVPENNHAVVVLQSRDATLSSRSLRMYYRRQPNALAEVNGELGGLVDSASLANGDTTIRLVVDLGDTDTADAFVAAASQGFDVINRLQPFEALGEDLAALNVVDLNTGAVRVEFFVEDFDTLPAANDYLYLSGYTGVPQIPIAFWSALTAHVTAGVLLEMRDVPSSEAWRATAQLKMQKALNTATPRSEEPETVVSETWD